MCTIVILRRPGHRWPLIVGANRDELTDRPWAPPGRHWRQRPHVVAGLDLLARGTWLGVNDDRLLAAVLNRPGSLGPSAGKRSRGELVLEALDHAAAKDAAASLRYLNPDAYRPFNLVVADSEAAFWLKSDPASGSLAVTRIPGGLSMMTAFNLDDCESPRISHYLPRFRAAPAPVPETGDWSAWETLLASRDRAPGAGPGGAMTIADETDQAPAGRKTESGGKTNAKSVFATVCGSLIALPDGSISSIRPVWRFWQGALGPQQSQIVDV